MGTYDLLMDNSGNKGILEQTVMKSSVLMDYGVPPWWRSWNESPSKWVSEKLTPPGAMLLLRNGICRIFHPLSCLCCIFTTGHKKTPDCEMIYNFLCGSSYLTFALNLKRFLSEQERNMALKFLQISFSSVLLEEFYSFFSTYQLCQLSLIIFYHYKPSKKGKWYFPFPYYVSYNYKSIYGQKKIYSLKRIFVLPLYCLKCTISELQSFNYVHNILRNTLHRVVNKCDYHIKNGNTINIIFQFLDKILAFQLFIEQTILALTKDNSMKSIV